jgi:hypothetical protein
VVAHVCYPSEKGSAYGRILGLVQDLW